MTPRVVVMATGYNGVPILPGSTEYTADAQK